MPKFVLFISVLTVILGVAYIVYTKNAAPSDTYRPGLWKEADSAVNQAQALFRLKKSQGEDFSNGPCLSNDLMPGWVADTVHSPRQSVDDLPQNQCQAYLEGRAKHFVELDLNGNVVRVK